MKSWNEVSTKPPQPPLTKKEEALYYNLERYLFETNYWNIKEPHRERFLSIKEQYREGKQITPAQVNAVRICWEIAGEAEEQSRNKGRGVSAKSFRGLPRGVYEEVY